METTRLYRDSIGYIMVYYTITFEAASPVSGVDIA